MCKQGLLPGTTTQNLSVAVKKDGDKIEEVGESSRDGQVVETTSTSGKQGTSVNVQVEVGEEDYMRPLDLEEVVVHPQATSD
jgi:hypothetical protein